MKTRIRELFIVSSLCAMLIIIFAMPSVVLANTYGNATALSFDDSWSNNITVSSEDKTCWFKVAIPSDGTLRFKIMDLGGSSGGLAWGIKDTDFSTTYFSDTIYGGSSTSPSSKLWELPISRGNYYLSCEAYNGSGRSFRLAASFISYGTNDANAFSFDSPQTIRIGSNMVGALTNIKGEDWFKFVITQAGKYNLKLYTSWYGGGMSWEINNSDLTRTIKSGTAYGGELSTPQAWTSEFELTPGTYYFHTSKYNGKGGKYTFSLTGHTHTPVTVKGYAATTYSTGLTDGTKCSVCGEWITPQKTIEKLISTQKKDQSVSGYTKNVKVKYSTVKKKKQVIKKAKYMVIKGTKGKVTFKKISGSGKIQIAKSGNITVKKGTKKGKYPIRISIKSAGNSQYYPWEGSVYVYVIVK